MFIPMGGEMPMLRGQNQSYHARGNRGSGGGVGRGWSEKNYVQRSQSDSSMAMAPHQEHNMANWYAQVPNMTYKNKFWIGKDDIPRDDELKPQENSAKETNFSKDPSPTTFGGKPPGFPVYMCEYHRDPVTNTTVVKQIEDAPPPPPPASPHPPTNTNKAGNQDQQNQQPKHHHRAHHNRHNFPRNNHSTNRSQQNLNFNSTNSNAPNNSPSVTNGNKTHLPNKRRSQYSRNVAANGIVQRAIRGRYHGSMESPAPETVCLELLELPDGFQTRFANMEVTQVPGQLFTGSSRWDKLSAGVWDKFYNSQQKDNTLKSKIHLWQFLWSMVKSSFPQFGLFLVGSTVTGFGCDSSDVDLCLLVRQSHMDQRSEAVMYLEQMLSIIKHCEFVVQPMIIQAKVPILKFRELREGFEVDLNCNNCVGIRNSHLLFCYSQIDWRVRPLVLVIKCWAHKHNINEAKNMTISSYSLVLMVIFFLQSGVSPPILPCLHSMYPEKFFSDSDVDRIDIHEQLNTDFVSMNKQPLGELLYDFLDYYSHFNYEEFAISVRLAEKVPIDICRQMRSYKNDPHQWKHLCIEEPFDLTNTARSVYDPEVFEKVKTVFLESFNNLEKSYAIESIFSLDLTS